MTEPSKIDLPLERRLSARLLDVYVRAGLVIALVVMCFQILSPFVSLLAWAVILAVTHYPAQQMLARRLGGRPVWAAALLVLGGLVLIVAPTTLLMVALGHSIHDLVVGLHDGSLQIPTVPAPPESVAGWPIIGEKVHALWSRAHADLAAVVQGMMPKIGDVSKQALGIVGSIGAAVVLFLLSYVTAGVVMAFGAAGARSARSIFDRIVGPERGERFTRLCTSTIRAVAMGVLGVALVQAIVIGVVMLIASIPFAGVIAVIALVLAIAQLPVLVVTLPVIVYVWMSGAYGTVEAIVYTVLLGLAGTIDNVLKPLMLGRGVEAPMPVILMGALGGMASNGILGMFVGATLLALGYQIFMNWVARNPDMPDLDPAEQVDK